jgi:hypothetical protein
VLGEQGDADTGVHLKSEFAQLEVGARKRG